MNDCHARARAPRAARRPLSTIHHGITRVDDYAWLRAANWQAVMRDPAQLDPAIRAHLEAENAYAEAFMADTKELQALRIAGVAHSPDHSLIAYAVDTQGLGVLHGQRHRSRQRRGGRFWHRRQQWIARMGGRQPYASLCLA
jgi:protease II